MIVLSALALGVFVACGGAAATQPGQPTGTADVFSAFPTPEVTNTPRATLVPEASGCTFERGAVCPGADLSGLDLSEILHDYTNERRPGADLREADLTGANLTGTNLQGVRLERSILRNANLQHANLTSAFLYKADLSRADLTDATMLYADVEDTVFDGAIFCRTRMPNNTINNDGC